MFENQKYDLNDYLFLVKLFQTTENYEDMVKALNKYIELNPKLSKEVKKYLCDGYKNIISSKRNSLYLLYNLTLKEESKQNNKLHEISIIKEKIHSELKNIFKEVHSMLDNYKDAFELAEIELPLYNEIRLGLALNYSVFEYDIMDNKNEAYEMAQKTYNDTMKILDEVEKKRASNNLLLIQIIKENLNMWSNEVDEE